MHKFGKLRLHEFPSDSLMFLFLITITTRSNGLSSNIKLFADDTSLFPVTKALYIKQNLLAVTHDILIANEHLLVK